MVDCDWCGSPLRGIVFTDDDDDLVVAGAGNWHCVFNCSNFTKIGESDAIPEGVDAYEGERIAKAYFAEQDKAEPVCEYKVGELVEVVSVSHANNTSCGLTDSFIGKVFRVHHVEHSGIVRVAGTEEFDKARNCPVGASRSYWGINPSDIRPLSGTYAERQAKAVAFYGWEAGSKVKVVQKVPEWNAEVGHVTSIDAIHGNGIETRKNHFHVPYFALEPA